MRTCESELTKRLTELLVPSEHTLFISIECNIEFCDWSSVFSTHSIAFWELHVYVFFFTEFAIEKSQVEVEDFDIQVIMCGDHKYGV